MGLKAIVKDWMPPIVLRQIQKRRQAARKAQAPQPVEPPEWEYVPQAWEMKPGTIGGWDQASVAAVYATRWEQFQKLITGTRPLGINYEGIHGPEPDNVDVHNQVMTLAYVVGWTAHRRDRLSILDFGGALGHHLAILRALFPELPLDYSCCELARVADQGRQLHPRVQYYTDDTWTTRKFDLVFASNSLHYSPNWEERLAQLAGVAESAVLITKVPTVQKAPSFVILQRAQRYGYGTEYLGWCFNETEFLTAAHKASLILEREFLVGTWEPYVVNAPEPQRHKGFLFRVAKPPAAQ